MGNDRQKNMKREYNYNVRELQLRSVGLLRAIDKVCREHGIQYYVIAGTLLGAVRGGGFIPWDDDIDIALLRKDYDMLMAHWKEWLPKPFAIVNHETSPRYPKYFAKLEDTDTTLVERIYLGYAGGVYMDIFALDDVPDSKFLRAIHFYKFHFVRKLLYFVYRDPYKHGKGLRSLVPLVLQKLRLAKPLHDYAQKVLKEYHGKENCNLVMTHDDGFKAYDKNIFGKPTYLDFEGISVAAPTIPEGFLSVLYGKDYMQPPPLEKRVSHYHDYCDLNTPYRDFDMSAIYKKHVAP